MTDTSLTLGFNPEQISLIKDTICKGSSDLELSMFLQICTKLGLDPLMKQVYAVKRWDSALGREVLTAQTSIDGFRIIAERSKKYAGQRGPFWCGKNGEWKDVWLDDEPPIACKVGVLRTDFSEPLWAVANFKAYAMRKKTGELTSFWLKMPELMIAKVAESLALRKAFPNDLSGIYTSDEMAQASNHDDHEEVKAISDEDMAKRLVAKIEKEKDRLPPSNDEFTNDDLEKALNTLDQQKEMFNEDEKNDVRDFMITFGKYKGKTLNDFKRNELMDLKNYVGYLKRQGDLRGKVLEFVQICDGLGYS